MSTQINTEATELRDVLALVTLPPAIKDWTVCGGCGITEPSQHTRDGLCLICYERSAQ